MKKLVFILLIAVFSGSVAKAQFSHLSDVELKTNEDYEEFAEQVLDCSYYLLMTPFDKKDNERTAATDFIVRWMKGCPSYQFTLSDEVKLLTDEKEDLIGLYVTCYAKQALENEESALSKTEIEKEAIDSLIQYCSKPGNKIKPTKEMKKRLS